MYPKNADGRLSAAQVAEEAERLRLIRAARAGDIEAEKTLLERWNLRILSGEEFARLAAGRERPPLPTASPAAATPAPRAPAAHPARRIAPAPRADAVESTGGGEPLRQRSPRTVVPGTRTPRARRSAVHRARRSTSPAAAILAAARRQLGAEIDRLHAMARTLDHITALGR
jgi:hypothetical protein